MNYKTWGLVAVGVIGVGLLAFGGFGTEAASITFIGRGIVKGGGDSSNINIYWTHVPASVERIAGVRTDTKHQGATIYKWEKGTGGALVKTKTSSVPTPQQEVVVRGVLDDNDHVVASWIVQNYRQFELSGKLQSVVKDTGSTDEGWITVNVTSSNMRDIVPARTFKETAIKGKDLRIRVNGLTKIMALGKVKLLDEVTAAQQVVTLEGQLLDEGTWVATELNETN